MPHSEVPNIHLGDGGKTVTLDVKVFGFDAKTPVEISGYATQDNGAIATFYTVQTMPDPVPEDGAVFQVPDVAVIPEDGFVPEDPIMVIARAADVWITKLIKDDATPDVVAWKSDEQTYHSAWKSAPPGGWQRT